MLKHILSLANFVTFMGLILAIIGIQMCFIEKTDFAIIILVICGICDGFDGTIAHKIRKKDDGGFGTQLDSLVDIIASGILPIVICYSLGFNRIIDLIVYIFFIITGVTRLAYYNIESKNNENCFIGIPITTSTIIIPILYYLFKNEIAFIITMFILGLLFITPIKIKKLTIKEKIIASVIGIIVLIIIKIGGYNG